MIICYYIIFYEIICMIRCYILYYFIIFTMFVHENHVQLPTIHHHQSRFRCCQNPRLRCSSPALNWTDLAVSLASTLAENVRGRQLRPPDPAD